MTFLTCPPLKNKEATAPITLPLLAHRGFQPPHRQAREGRLLHGAVLCLCTVNVLHTQPAPPVLEAPPPTMTSVISPDMVRGPRGVTIPADSMFRDLH